MRKSILIFILFAASGYCAALNGTMQWDVRTTGADTNSGGFDPGVVSPGTDESQGATGTAMTITLVTGTTGTCSPGCTSTTHGPGNTIIIASGSGCSTGTYEILSQTAGTVTVNATMGSATDACVGVMGGSKLTIAATLALAVGGNTVNIQAGTYTVTSTLVTPSVSYISLVGYQTTHADGGTKPLITTATNSTDLIDSGSTSTVYPTIYDNLSLSNTAGTAGIGIVKTSNNGPIVVRNCKLAGFSYGLNGDNQGSHYIFYPGVVLVNTELATNGYGVYNDGQIWLIDSYVHGSTTLGVETNENSNNWDTLTVVGSVIDSNNVGVVADDIAVFVNSVVSNSTSDGVRLAFVTTNWTSINSIYYGNGGYGVKQANAGGPFPVGGYANNAWGSNTSGNTEGLTILSSASANDVALTASPFVGGGNFALNSTSGGGAALKAKGFPGVTAAGTGYADIGALQTKGSSGGAATAYAIQQ